MAATPGLAYKLTVSQRSVTRQKRVADILEPPGDTSESQFLFRQPSLTLLDLSLIHI